jgi:hypothetical protein
MAVFPRLIGYFMAIMHLGWHIPDLFCLFGPLNQTLYAT